MPREKQSPALSFADQVGFYMESSGQPRLAGRVLGWLVACDPPMQSALAMSKVLSVSRSAISPITQAMVHQGLIERVKVPGQRETRYHFTMNSFRRFQEEGQRGLVELRRVSAQALEELGDRSPETNERLKVFHDFHAFLERQLPELMKKWEQECSQQRR